LGTDFGRGTYLALLSAGITSSSQLADMGSDSLVSIVGEPDAQRIAQRLAGG
jgi:hypothetical protein